MVRPSWIKDSADPDRAIIADRLAVACNKPEPQRSAAIKDLRSEVCADLKKDLSRYREVVRSLHRSRSYQGPMTWFQQVYQEPNMAVALKHNHLLSNFSNLAAIDRVDYGKQMELF